MLYSENSPEIGNKQDYIYLSRIYAHGKLEKLLGNDILYTDDISLYNNIYNCYHEGDKLIVNSNIMIDRGEVLEVVMYLWKSEDLGIIAGLVCLLEDDIEANKYAKSLYDKS